MQQKVIKIASAEKKLYKNKDGKDFTVIKIQDEDGDKYSFYTHKIDGEETKAFMGWKTGGLDVGSEVAILYDEEDASFINDANKTINFKRRKIALFEDPEKLDRVDSIL